MLVRWIQWSPEKWRYGTLHDEFRIGLGQVIECRGYPLVSPFGIGQQLQNAGVGFGRVEDGFKLIARGERLIRFDEKRRAEGRCWSREGNLLIDFGDLFAIFANGECQAISLAGCPVELPLDVGRGKGRRCRGDRLATLPEDFDAKHGRRRDNRRDVGFGGSDGGRTMIIPGLVVS